MGYSARRQSVHGEFSLTGQSTNNALSLTNELRFKAHASLQPKSGFCVDVAEDDVVATSGGSVVHVIHMS